MAPRSILITGCSKGGIGSEVAIQAQEAGLRVIATVRNPAKIDPALSALPNVEVVELDVTSSASIAAAVKTVDAKLNGQLDILFNNSGVGLPGPVAEIDLKEARKMFDVNFWGVLEVSQAFLPMLIKTKGVVVNVSSVGGFAHLPLNGLYGASKAAINHVGETLRLELAPFEVRVITIATGGVRTEIFNNIPDLNLASDSRYKKIEEKARIALEGKAHPEMIMPLKQYAKSVVPSILGRNTNGIIWRGGGAGFIKYIVNYLPAFIQDRIFVSGIDLDQLAKDD